MGIAQRLRSRIRHTQTSLWNTAKLMSGNRFTAPYHSDYQVVVETETYSLRRYTSHRGDTPHHSAGSCVLLVPPLMVTAEIYDMSPDLSAVLWLLAQGHDVWLVDFGSPHATPQGLEKTLTDHVVAVSSAVDELVKRRPGTVHLIGYSQGGMFIYQAAAFRRCKDIASLVTMGSPVDILRNFPIPVHSGLLANLLHAAEEWVRGPLERLPFLPGWLTSLGFKLLSPQKELRHFLLMLRFLDDEEALKKLEPTRRFLGGEGFIAWPGPALHAFVDDFVVHNRMMSGGFVIAGQTVSLSDLSVPILYFRGSRDDFARPRSVSAIERVVPHDDVFGMTVDAGHLGLVVGSKARDEVWSTVDKWLDHRDRNGARPSSIGRLLSSRPRPLSGKYRDPLSPVGSGQELDQESGQELDQESDAAPVSLRTLSAAPRALWRKAGDLALDVTSGARWIRWQLPRVVDLLRFWDSAQMSMAATLADQARAIPDRTFFLWEGRAYSYQEADRRVTQIAAALYACGVRHGQTVGLLMDNHPDCLTALSALSRLGAVPALLNPSTRGAALSHALQVTQVRDLIALSSSPDLVETFGVRRLLIGGAASPLAKESLAKESLAKESLAKESVDLESIRADFPASVQPNPGRASDIACLMFTSGTTGKPKAVKISNRRWLMAAIAATSGCDLTPNDTVYCCLPLHHGTGLLLAAGGALLGGCRLAIAPRFSVRSFWEDIRRSGVTVVFYVGELCRYLVSAPPSPLERSHAVRLFVGNGMRADVWRELLRRFGRVSVLEFYAATEGNAVMTNLTGEKIGSVGRVPLGLVRTLVVKYDPETESYPRTEDGFLIPAETNQPGMLLVEIQKQNPLSRFDGYTDPAATEAKILRSVLQKGDAWFCSGDLMREDQDGDFWFVDRVGDTFRWKGENVSTEQVAAVLSELPFVEICAVYGVRVTGQEGRAGMAAIKLRAGSDFDPRALFVCIEKHLIDAARPRFVRLVSELHTTETLKIQKQPLLADGIDLLRTGPLYVYDRIAQSYKLVHEASQLAALLPSL
ncbi:MAG: long-chain-acyl-CoA synthetase [Myxococcales bacterium]|nr:long-chain-acyl-CoA synthetase [Myxococcales bacterium]